MKKILCLIFLLGASNIYAQEVEETGNETMEPTFNRWSIDVNGGVHKPTRNFSVGYFTHTPSFWNADLGVRYMLTDKVGLKLDFGYYNIKNSEEGSLPFESRYLRTSLQGVVNAGTLLGLRKVTNRLNVLVHGGGGYSRLNAQEPVELDDTDQMLHLIGGITPQIRLSDRVSLNGDLSVIGNIRQDLNWDGTASNIIRGVDGMMVTASIGLSIYLGGNEKHADWYVNKEKEDTLEELEDRVAKLEDDLIDSDQDGVPDYLDREPNTVSGVVVDSKGIAVDKNKNGIPDELEDSLDQRYAMKGEGNNSTINNISSNNTIKKLIDDGYVNVYFQFDSDKPETYSLEAINYLIRYMKENPSVRGEIIGYADEIGDPAYNRALSERRASRVQDILVASGVDAGRLTITANGEDPSVDTSSSAARQLVRRVTFRILE